MRTGLTLDLVHTDGPGRECSANGCTEEAVYLLAVSWDAPLGRVLNGLFGYACYGHMPRDSRRGESPAREQPPA